MKTVLLTGGAGYIGSHTAVELLKAGYKVVIADDLSNSRREAVVRVEDLGGDTVPLYVIDVADSDALDRVFTEHKIDAVIHFAGSKAVGESVQKPVMYYRNNIGTTLTLLDVMEKHGTDTIIFSSSATVYGTPKACPIPETAETGHCSNPYGWTKYMIEQILTDTARVRPLRVMLLRYFNPVGAHPSGRIGEMPSYPNNLMPYITQVAIGKRERLSVFGNDYPTKDGTGVRDYIHVVDLALGHVAALRYAESHGTGVEIFNLGTGIGYSVLDIVHAFESANQLTIPYVIAPRRAGDIAECYADASKAWEKMGWKTLYSLEDMCRDSWNWQKNNPNGYED